MTHFRPVIPLYTPSSHQGGIEYWLEINVTSSYVLRMRFKFLLVNELFQFQEMEVSPVTLEFCRYLFTGYSVNAQLNCLREIIVWLNNSVDSQYISGSICKISITTISYWPFHATGLFLYPVRITENLWFSNVFRGHRKIPLEWKRMIIQSSKVAWRRPGIFIVNFEHISHLVLVFLLLTLSR